MAINGKIKEDREKFLRKLFDRKGVMIIEASAYSDHIFMLVSILTKYSILDFVEYLKGKISLEIFESYANLKYKYGNRSFWCKGYYVNTVSRN